MSERKYRHRGQQRRSGAPRKKQPFIGVQHFLKIMDSVQRHGAKFYGFGLEFTWYLDNQALTMVCLDPLTRRDDNAVRTGVGFRIIPTTSGKVTGWLVMAEFMVPPGTKSSHDDLKQMSAPVFNNSHSLSELGGMLRRYEMPAGLRERYRMLRRILAKALPEVAGLGI